MREMKYGQKNKKKLKKMCRSFSMWLQKFSIKIYKIRDYKNLASKFMNAISIIKF